MNTSEPILLKELNEVDYESLISYRIRKILMICSNYDAFILEEDGQIAEHASIAAPTPWTALDARSIGKETEKPHRIEPTVNTVRPYMRTFLMAPLSQIFPNISIRPAMARK